MNIKTTFAVLISSFSFITDSLAQSTDILWSKSYGGSKSEFFPIIRGTQDGGYIVGGSTYSNDGDVTINHGDLDAWIIKLDQSGNLQWQKTYGGSDYEDIEAIEQTADHGFLFVASTASTSGDVTGQHGQTDAWVVKLDSTGVIEWKKCYGGTSFDAFESILIDDNKDYVFLGYTSSTDGDLSNNFNHGFNDVWLLKTDSLGNIISSYTYGSSEYDYGTSICKGSFGEYVLLCEVGAGDGDASNSNYHPATGDYWILMIDSIGQINYSRCFGGSSLDGGLDIIRTSDGGYVAIGYSHSNDGDVTGHYGDISYSDYWIIKINATGDLLWEKTYGGTHYDDCYSIIELAGNYFIGGSTTSDDGDVENPHGGVLQSDAWLLKLNSNGDLLWQKCYGGTSYDGITSIIESTDGGFTCSGYSYSSDDDVLSNQGLKDFWVFKLAATTPVNVPINETSFQVFPNPASNVIYFINNEHKDVTINLLNLLGQVVYTDYAGSSEDIEIPVSYFPKGLYLIKVKQGLKTEQHKIILK